jgi:hypothetical protein
MWFPALSSEQYETPLHIPTQGVFDSPTVALWVNAEWAGILDGLIGKLLNRAMWDGSEAAIDAVTQEVQQLLVSLGSDPMTYFGPLFPLQRPVAADFSWVNQGASTITASNNGLYLLGASAANPNLRVQVKAQPSKPYKIEARFSMGGRTTGTQFGGLCWRNSTSGALVTAGITNNNTLVIGRYTSPTVLSSNYLSIALSNFAVNGDFFLRLEDDSTNRIVSLSLDGENWLQAHSIGNTDFLSADQVGFFVNPTSSGLPAAVWLQHWKES